MVWSLPPAQCNKPLSIVLQALSLPDLIPWIYSLPPLYNNKGFDLGLVFPYFLQFKYEFCNKELMIWATVSSRSCFCWVYRASPSLAAKNIINLILLLSIWWCLCVDPPPVLLEKGICYDQCILLTKLLAFALLHFILQGQTCLLLQIFLDFILLHSSSLWWKGHLFWV